jgi:hypothetical protein
MLYTVVTLEMIALVLPLSFSCTPALLKSLTSGQYAAVLLVLTGAVLLVLAGAVLLVVAAVVLLLVLPHPASNDAAVRASISIAARRGAQARTHDRRAVMSIKRAPTWQGRVTRPG